MALPWACDHREGARSALFDLAVLDGMPDETLIARAMQDGDGRAALWVAESLAARRVDRRASRLALTRAWKANIVEAYYPEAIVQAAAAGTTQPVDVAGSFFLFAITFAADQRAFDTVMASPPKIPSACFARSGPTSRPNATRVSRTSSFARCWRTPLPSPKPCATAARDGRRIFAR